ncbi:6-phosphogluconolactonase [Paralcaligenes sp. KSB-10]|uniref:6-phosphogluconolactonase n=1 Tax=Paralcaligenes sp. KSB-10 TaxID=2901142 RepID=UPI001E6420AA|nr:6-phosphogluconolactonase [Paralcaligenes sp. KSB-10]UHL66042.1 6-phosphogluconolactonase [Paralcaligenes sp. KSB-10]
MMSWHAYEQDEPCIAALTHAVAGTLQQSIDLCGTARLAVSGGRSPIPFFARLSHADLDWPKITITLVDERFVTPGDPDSNENLVRSHLLVNRARQARFQGLLSDPGNIESCLEQANRQTETITLAVLGMGENGHTASLFPLAPELTQALDPGQTRNYVRITPTDAPHTRISMTLAALLRAQSRILFISGPLKRQVMERAAQRATPALPISFLLTSPDAPIDVYWHP